jgi:osmotically-inducible protein OsmY
LPASRHGRAITQAQHFRHLNQEAAMKKTLVLSLLAGLAACGDQPATVAAVTDGTLPKALAAPIEVAKPDPDKDLAQRVSRAIEDAKLQGIDVVAAEGIVTLWGTTVNARERDRAAEVARNIEGVSAVENRLAVVTGS